MCGPFLFLDHSLPQQVQLLSFFTYLGITGIFFGKIPTEAYPTFLQNYYL